MGNEIVYMAQMLRPQQLQMTRLGFKSLFCWMTLGKWGQLSKPHEGNSKTKVMGVIYEVLSPAPGKCIFCTCQWHYIITLFFFRVGIGAWRWSSVSKSFASRSQPGSLERLWPGIVCGLCSFSIRLKVMWLVSTWDVAGLNSKCKIYTRSYERHMKKYKWSQQ